MPEGLEPALTKISENVKVNLFGILHWIVSNLAWCVQYMEIFRKSVIIS